MKKWVSIVLVCLLAVVCLGWPDTHCLAEMRPESYNLRYTLTKRTEASLDISSTGKATCRGYIRAISSDSTINITVKLMKKNGTSWNLYKSWSATNVTSTAELLKTCTVTAGTYKVTVVGTVKSSSGATESVTISSGEKSYP